MYTSVHMFPIRRTLVETKNMIGRTGAQGRSFAAAGLHQGAKRSLTGGAQLVSDF
jgi:hypothetical protein